MTHVSKNTSIIGLLKSGSLLKDASNAFVEDLARQSRVTGYAAGAVIIEKDAPLDICVFIAGGYVELVQKLDGNQMIAIDRLREGASFGEACFYAEMVSEYTYVAGEDATLVILSKDRLDGVFSRFPEEAEKFQRYGRVQPIFARISKLALFRSLSTDRMWELAGNLLRKEVLAGEVLIREGDQGDFLYIVEKGSFQVYREKTPEQVIATLSEDGIIGEMALFTQSRRNASVRALDDTVVLSLNRADFLALVKEQKELFESIKHLVDQRTEKSPDADQPEVSCKIEPTSMAEEFPIDLPQPAVTPPKRLKPFQFPIIYQQSQMDCSAACLAMISKYYGIRPGLNYLREQLRISTSGASLTNIIRTAKEIGYGTCAYKSTWGQLETAPLPAITNWQGYHWVVVYQVEKDSITIGDPGMGRVQYSRKEFEEGWTRFTLFLAPTAKFLELTPARRSFKRFLPHVLSQKTILCEVMVASLGSKFFGIFLPLLNMHIIDNVLIKGETRFFLPSILAVAVLTALQIAVLYFQKNLSLFAGNKISLSVLSGFYKHLMSLPIAYFETRPIGDITTRLDQNETITDFLSDTGFQIFLDFLTAVVVSIIFFSISPILILMTLAFSLLDIAQILISSPILQRNNREIFAKEAKMESHFIESLNGMRTVQTLGIGRQIRWKYESRYTAYMNTELKGEVIGSGMEVATGFVSSLTTAALMFTGAFMVFDGKMSIGGLIAFLAMVNYVREPLASIVSTWDDFQETLNAVERVDDIYDSKPEVADDDRERLLALPPLKGNIHCSDVTFRYHEDAQDNTLQNISLSIEAGQTVAFVGRSGSGKSTLIKLLYRFYAPNSGTLNIDGFDLRDCQLASLRKQIGVVLQEDVLFSGTIRENIARGKPLASFGEIVAAAKTAAAHEFITSLPAGYETMVLEGGANFSGGQRQRISLARTFLQDPNILILDEGTSALDNESERFVIDNIRERFQDRTVIMIAHRLSTVKACDKIFVLDKGTIIETGNHDSLMDNRGMYYLLNSRQE
jgi:HlyB family type I secretion system ABC transporter